MRTPRALDVPNVDGPVKFFVCLTLAHTVRGSPVPARADAPRVNANLAEMKSWTISSKVPRVSGLQRSTGASYMYVLLHLFSQSAQTSTPFPVPNSYTHIIAENKVDRKRSKSNECEGEREMHVH